MTKWVNAAVLDNGLQYVKDNANAVVLVSTYSAGDSYATVQANKLAQASMVSGDFTLGNGAASSRNVTAASVIDSSGDVSGGGSGMHIAYVDTVDSLVLWVTDETSDLPIAAGRPVLFPALTLTLNQPTP